MKKLLAVVLAAGMMLSLCACSIEENYVVDKKGNILAGSNIYLTPDEILQLLCAEEQCDPEVFEGTDVVAEFVAQMKEEGVYCGTKTINGVECVGVIVGANKNVTKDISNNEGITLTKSEFICESKTVTEDASKTKDSMAGAFEGAEEYSELFSDMSVEVNITLPEKIVLTNGTLSKDKKTVTFDMETSSGSSVLYAFTAKSDKFTTLPGSESGYTKASSLTVSSYDKISEITLNGEKYTGGKKIKLSKDGKYTITVTTDRETKTFEVVRDKKKPTVKGVAEGKTYSKSVKITFSDKTSGIKTAKLDGKKIKSGTTVKTVGNHTLVVTDKAGNKTTVKFTVK